MTQGTEVITTIYRVDPREEKYRQEIHRSAKHDLALALLEKLRPNASYQIEYFEKGQKDMFGCDETCLTINLTKES